ncbi:MAG TPA: single-stranded DNA-binding protein, partial [Syntrophales bacterium]|nr:single-stranded DNA-binding protein [Syntrophales bacterium]
RLVYVERRLQTRSWEDKEGQKRFTTEIVASNMQILDRGPSRDTGADDRAPGPAEMEQTSDDDVPF